MPTTLIANRLTTTTTTTTEPQKSRKHSTDKDSKQKKNQNIFMALNAKMQQNFFIRIFR